jgi:hypothetical protein
VGAAAVAAFLVEIAESSERFDNHDVESALWAER